ncbi:MAG TPA: ABC transporter permease [Gemmatimonadaceae bacterium]
MIASTRQHLRSAARSVLRAPGFTIVSVLILALGIGLSTAVFTVADAILLRRLPVADQERVVLLWGEKDGDPIHYPMSVVKARTFVRQSRTLSAVTLTTYEGAWQTSVREGDHVSQINRALVSGNFFEMLGARPVLGRTLRPSDDVFGAAPVAVLSYAAWQRRFGGRRDVVGQRIVQYDDGVSLTIVGVMPPGLDYPKGADVWSAMFASVPDTGLQFMALNVVGRIAPRSTAANARDELTAFYRRPEMAASERTFRGMSQTLPLAIVGETRPALFAFSAAAALLLLITCLNVANLLLVRGLARTREMAMRAALGGSRRMILTQLLTENALLALVGGALGVGFAAAAVRLFVAFAPTQLPRLGEIRLDAMALVGALAITTFAMLFFALAPAMLTSRVDAHEALRAGTRQQGSRRSRLLAEGLVAVQVALAMLVLSAAGLITRSLVSLERADLAFDPSRLSIAELSMRTDQYDDVKKQRALVERVLTRVTSVPGVRAVAPIVAVPFSGTGGWDGQFAAEGQSPAEVAANPMLDMGVVTPEFFQTFGVRAIAGRVLTAEDRDGSAPVVVISESVARHYWPAADPIGKRLLLRDAARPPITVVGVVPDLRYRELGHARASVYFPLRQSIFPFVPTVLAIRTESDPASMTTALRSAVAESDPGVALASLAPFETFLAKPLAQPRVNALLLSIFAVAAVVLSAVGLLGVMLTMVRQRRREFGVRVALGATESELRRMVLMRGLTVAATGLAVGLMTATGLNRFLETILYNVSPTDNVTLVAAGALLLAIAAVASVIPARSAGRLDPVAALRADG